jgi:2-polyprenyl-3-methyl-5-hydroxy-6-metoxy-1,4-benzoquinol methylase
MLCGGFNLVPHFSGRVVRAAPAPATYRITHSQRRLVGGLVRCLDCGMVSLPLQLAPPVTYADAADPYYLEQAAERIANAHRLLDLVPSGGRLLEVGCACGFLLVAARERGFAVEGVEVSAWAADHARDAYGLAVQTGSLETIELPAATYDVVVMADVIEHLMDPRRTVRHLLRLLRPGGRLLLLTPDVGSRLARVLGRRWWGLLDDHYFYFSRATLHRLLTEEGFAVERVTGFGRAFRLSHWVFKLEPYNRALHGALTRATRALRLDAVRIAINLGDQMACVARKP